MDYKKLSKSVSYILRHAPDSVGLVLDVNGYVDIVDLCAALDDKYPGVNEDDLYQMDVKSNKKRFEIGGGRIKAMYGHTTSTVDIKYDSVKPPNILFHGTSADAAAKIITDGIKKMGRQYVHCSDSPELARIVGKRKTSEPLLFVVLAKKAHDEGVEFFHGNDNTWLSGDIPAKYLLMSSFDNTEMFELLSKY